MESTIANKSGQFTIRDTYVNVADVKKPKTSVVEAFADIIAFEDANPVLEIIEGGAVSLMSRVITSDAPITLRIKFTGTAEAGIELYAHQLDQPISVVVADDQPAFLLALGGENTAVGAQIKFTAGKIEVAYIHRYEAFELATLERQRCVKTQLRLSSIFFWTSTDVAIDLAYYVAAVCAQSQDGALLNMQAISLAQQLAISKSIGPGIDYVPVLTLDSYQETLEKSIGVVDEFQKQYDAFANREAQIKDQIDAWDIMLQRSKDMLDVDNKLLQDAQLKLDNARAALDRANLALQVDQADLAEKEIEFRVGLKTKQTEEKLKAAITVITTVFSKHRSFSAYPLTDDCQLL